MNILD